MRVAFYLAEHGDWFDKAIAIWTRSKYSHVELVLGGTMCISASSRQGRVRTEDIDIYGGHWEVVEFDIEIPPAELQRRIDRVLGAGYDWLGIFFYKFLPFRTQDRKKYWCSEVVAYLLGIEDDKLSPQELYEAVILKNRKTGE